MSWAIGSTYQNAFATVLDNVPTDADSTPTLTLYVGGVASGATVTVTDVGVGEYTVSVSLSGLSMGDVCQVKGSATIDSVSYPVHLEPFQIARSTSNGVDISLNAANSSVMKEYVQETLDYNGYLSRKIADAFNAVDLTDYIDSLKSQIWTHDTRTLTAHGDSTGVTTLLNRLTTARASLLDSLPSTTVATQTDVQNTQDSTRVKIVMPKMIQRPDSGTQVITAELYLYDVENNMEAPDSPPTISVANTAGDDRSANLSSTSMSLVSTGRYRVNYTVSSTDAFEPLSFSFTVIEGGKTLEFGEVMTIVQVADLSGAANPWNTSMVAEVMTELDDLNARITDLRASELDKITGISQSTGELNDKVDDMQGDVYLVSQNVVTAINNTTSILSILGNWTLSNGNDLLSALKALFRKNASTPSDIGGTYDPATDSLEAQQEQMQTIASNVNTAVTNSSDSKTAAQSTNQIITHLTEDTGSGRQFTENALSAAPTGSGGSGDASSENQQVIQSQLQRLTAMLSTGEKYRIDDAHHDVNGRLLINRSNTYSAALNNDILIHMSEPRITQDPTQDNSVVQLVIRQGNSSVTIDGTITQWVDEGCKMVFSFEPTAQDLQDLQAKRAEYDLLIQVGGNTDQVLVLVHDAAANVS